MADWHVGLAELIDRIEGSGETRAVVASRHGTMRAILYAPRGQDLQAPHDQDEVYIVQSGAGTMVKAGQSRRFGPGDLIFVEAGAAHHFEFFSDDFVAWAIFWGPEGGEG